MFFQSNDISLVTQTTPGFVGLILRNSTVHFGLKSVRYLTTGYQIISAELLPNYPNLLPRRYW